MEWGDRLEWGDFYSLEWVQIPGILSEWGRFYSSHFMPSLILLLLAICCISGRSFYQVF